MQKKNFRNVSEAINFVRTQKVRIVYIASKHGKCELVYRP